MQNSLTKLESGVFLGENLDEDIAWISIQLTLEIVAATGLRPVRAENTGAVSPAAIQEANRSPTGDELGQRLTRRGSRDSPAGMANFGDE